MNNEGRSGWTPRRPVCRPLRGRNYVFNIPHDEHDGFPADAAGANGGGAQFDTGLDSAKLGELTRLGKAALAASGVMPSGIGFGPYGWDYVPELRRMVVNPTEAKNVLRAFRAVDDDGMTISGLVRQFNDEGIPSKRGCKWGYASMRSMLTNPAAKGLYFWGKTRRDRGLGEWSEARADVPEDEWIEIEGFAPGIVPADVFDRVQAKLSEQMRARKGSGSA